MSFRYDGGRKLLFVVGKIFISCFSGLNCKKEKKFKTYNFYLS